MSEIVKEINEALVASDKTLIHLNNALKEINAAQNWGIFDILGGGLISTMIKHDRLDGVKKQLSLAKDEAEILRRELADVDMVLDISLNISDFLHFADYFFDGIFADLTVQSKMDVCETDIKKAIVEIERIKKLLLKARETEV